MSVISEEKLILYLERVIALSAQVLPLLSDRGTEPPPPEIDAAYLGLIASLMAERENDEHLRDDSWNWIFEPTEDSNLIRLYGRLAWVNLQLLELL